MLRQDVVDACDAGRFGVYAVERIEEALALFTGMDPTELLAKARARSSEFWSQVRPR